MGGDILRAWKKSTAIFRQIPAKDFHDFGPRRDWVTGAKTHPGGNQAKCQRVVPGHDHLLAGLELAVNELESFENISQRMAVAGMKRSQSIIQHTGIFSTKPFAKQLFQLRHV